ncbi:hypothetical protein K9M79_03775 [Candidatus Woesearchaeota archaeon]|nr:hypothetical protein [Candidatus Woesearchaeota archaeon]
MYWITLLFFISTAYGFGYTITTLFGRKDHDIEINVMRLGIGLGIIPMLGILMNLIGIPLDYRIFWFLALIMPVVDLIRHHKKFIKAISGFKPVSLKKSFVYFLIVLVCFGFIFSMFHKGSFSYPWLEDGDPYHHVAAAQYIAHSNTFSKPADMYIAWYLEPYPVGYPVLMGLLTQTNWDVVWTLKFFNALIVSLSIPFFYFMAKRFFKNSTKALFATIFLTVIPAFQSHFIFSESLALMLFFPAIYCVLKIDDNKYWAFIAMPVIAAVLTTQQLSTFIFAGLMGTYWLIKAIAKKNLLPYVIVAGVGGGLLAASFYVPTFFKYSFDKAAISATADSDPLHVAWYNYADSSSVRDLGVTDFVHPCMGSGLFSGCPKSPSGSVPYGNKTDNPTGFGWVMFLLILFGAIITAMLLYSNIKKEGLGDYKYLILLVWLGFLFLMVIGDKLPVKILPNRCWAFLCIPAVMVAANGWNYAVTAVKKLWKIPRYIPGAVIVILLIFTSWVPKETINTSSWSPHVFIPSADNNDLRAYMGLSGLPMNTYVFDFCKPDRVIMASGMMSPIWDPEIYDYRYSIENKLYQWDQDVFRNITSVDNSRMLSSSPIEFSNWLKSKGYSIILIGPDCDEKFGPNTSIRRFEELRDSGLFVHMPQLPAPHYLMRVN